MPGGGGLLCRQLDPTLEEINDIKTAVSEAVTNAIVHAYPDRLGKVALKLRLKEGGILEILVRDWGVGICGRGAGPDPAVYHRERGALRDGPLPSWRASWTW